MIKPTFRLGDPFPIRHGSGRKTHPMLRKERNMLHKERNMKRRKKMGIGFDVLPDEILVCILSFLTLKEAVRTSVFSNRWRYLWQFTSGTLDFDCRRWVVESEFIIFVNQIMKLHQSPSIEKLFIRFRPLEIYYPLVETWISFAMKKNVKILQLDWSGINPRFPGINPCFPLHLDLFLSKTMSSKTFLCHLTCVHLFKVDVADDLIEHIVSHALRIENITVVCSRLTQNLLIVGSTLKSFKIARCLELKSLKIVCPSLLSLQVKKCSILESLEVVGLNLVSLEYYGSKLMRSFMDIHPLPELHLTDYYSRVIVCETNKLRKYYSWLKNLKKLTLVLSRMYRTNVRDVGFLMPRIFRNLKQLDLHLTAYAGEYLGYVRLLVMGCPLLSGLVISLVYWYYEFDLEKEKDDEHEQQFYEYEHKCLKTVKIINFAGLCTDYDLALWFLVFTNLDKMVIRIFDDPVKTIRRSEARTEAMRLLKYLSEKTKLVVI